MQTEQNKNDEKTMHYVNSYYRGKINDRISSKLDVDFLTGNQNNSQKVINTELNVNENVVTNSSQNYNLIASKLVFTTPVAQGDFTYGGEYAHTHNTQKFNVIEQANTQTLKSNNNKANQNLWALFVAYGKVFKDISLEIGLRYEDAGFDYFVNNKKQKEQSRTFKDWFHRTTLTFERNNFHMMIRYDRHISRPSYYQLRNNIQYNSAYAYESGNPFLKPSIDNRLSLSLKWKNFLFTANYDIYRDDILLVSRPYTNEILLSKTENFDNFRNLSLLAFYSAKVSIWRPSVELGFSKDFFEYGTSKQHYSTPIYHVKSRNNFAISKTLQFDIDFNYTTNGHSEIDYVYGALKMNVYISKTFFNNRLRINIQGTDLFGTDNYKRRRVFNNVSTYVLNDLNKRGVAISVIYNFNTTKNKYKGEKASEEINRL